MCLGGEDRGGEGEEGLDLLGVEGTGLVLFVGSDGDRRRVATIYLADIGFAFADRVGVGTIDDEDDAVGSVGESFAD